MGLDAIELLLDIEEEFGIRLPETGFPETIGEMYQSVLAELERKGEAKQIDGEHPLCLSSSVFYRFRKVLVQHMGIERRRVRLDTPFAQLVPRRGRARWWRNLGEKLELNVPPLHPRLILKNIAAGAAIVISPLCVVLTLCSFQLGIALLGFVLTSAATMAYVGSEREVNIPPKCATVRNMITTLAENNRYRLLKFQADEKMWQRLRFVIANQAGVKVQKVTAQTRFIDLDF